MKKITRTYFLVLALMTFSLSTAFAQKFGHINSSNLLELLPETITANTELETYKAQLEKALEAKVEVFDAEVQAYIAKRPNLAPKDAQAQEAALGQKEQDLYKERQEGEQQVMKKREELLKPIFTKVDTAIKAVGKEGGFQMIFDSSTFNVLLFAEETADVLPLVKAKLGL